MSNGEPGTNNSAHRHDWDTQRERLSTYLDNQLAPDEREALERHLPTCPRCESELAELRRTVALLRAMPAPVLPRSFALPEIAVVESIGSRERPAHAADRERSEVAALVPTPMRRRDRATPAPRRPAPWAAIAQWAGGLAAVAGLLVLCSGALPILGPRGGESAAAGPANIAPARTPQHAFATTPPTTATANANATASGANQALTPSSATTTPPIIATPQPTPSYTIITHGPEVVNRPEIPVLPLTGGGLLLGGGLIFIAASVARRRS